MSATITGLFGFHWKVVAAKITGTAEVTGCRSTYPHYTGNLAIDLKSGKIAGENETDPGNLQKCRLRAGSHRNYNVGAKMSPTWRFKIKIAKCKLENQNRNLI